MAEQDPSINFETEQAAFVSMLAEAGEEVSDELLEQRWRVVQGFEGLLTASQYVSISGDFHLQHPQGSGKPSESGYTVEGLRLPASELWVGPLNRQTIGYAKLDGEVNTLERHGVLPLAAWRGEPWLSPGYPLIADMSKLAITSVDSRADDFTATREFGANHRLYGPYWDRLEGRTIADIHGILDQTYKELLSEGDSDIVAVTKTEAEAYCANLGQGFGFHNMFITFTDEGKLSCVETGPFYGSGWNTRFDFTQDDDGSVAFTHRPHTTFDHVSDYVPAITTVTDLDDDRRGLAVMDFRMMLGRVERLVMAPVSQASHVEGFGYYAKDKAA